MKNFALIGVAGYIAPRHLKAIKETGNNLVAALDKSDNVGILDSYFPNADFFTEFERFDRHLEMLKRKGTGIDYVSICTPNYLHDSHIRFALRHGADAICEKPLVLKPWNLEALEEIEKETGRKISTILQLRLHPSLISLKKEITAAPKEKVFEVDLRYITSRGKWYHYSWKGDASKSGGIATNIGIHFFDMLIWLFGAVKDTTVLESNDATVTGHLTLERARVNWELSIDPDRVPAPLRDKGTRTFRSIRVDGKEVEFSEGFTDLHTLSYQLILEGKGWGIRDAAPSIRLTHQILELAAGR